MRKEAASSANTRLLMGEIVGVHGIKGLLKIKIFSDSPESLADYAPLYGGDDKTYAVEQTIPHGNIWLVRIAGIADRTAAEKLRGLKLYAARDQLPDIKNKNTYYHADLVGLAAHYPDGSPLGKVITVANFGAGDLLEIKPAKGASFYVPFTNAIVPDVDLDNKRVTVDPPPGLIE